MAQCLLKGHYMQVLSLALPKVNNVEETEQMNAAGEVDLRIGKEEE